MNNNFLKLHILLLIHYLKIAKLKQKLRIQISQCFLIIITLL